MRDASPQIPRYREKTRIVHYALEEGWTVLDPRQEREAEGFRAGFGRFVLFVGRLVAYKGLETLLDAAPRIRGRIVVVGDGPLRGLLAGRIAREGLGDKVFLAGAVDDAKPWFAACALLVLPSVSRLETFGIVQIEAMAFGKPCVSSDLPTGVTDINEHEVTGLACPPGAPDALADAINRLLDDPGLRARLGEQARGKVLREHSPRAVRQELLELYREVAAP
jgi:rhamnosyl/mannosyltransferase